MSYSIIVFWNLIFHFLGITLTPTKILNNFSSCEILIFQMVEYFYFFKLLQFTTLLIIANYLGN